MAVWGEQSRAEVSLAEALAPCAAPVLRCPTPAGGEGVGREAASALCVFLQGLVEHVDKAAIARAIALKVTSRLPALLAGALAGGGPRGAAARLGPARTPCARAPAGPC